ncbi:MAG TPA: threonine/serine exporter [Clostridiales bacterium]|nr:threonine/serine exporter [Clostridiales bacterium]
MFKNVLFSSVAAISYGIIFNVQKRNLLLAGINGGLGYLLYAVTAANGFESHVGMFIASLAISIFAEVFARLRKAPASIFLAVALIPLVPGGTMFQFALNLLEGNNDLALVYGIKTTLEAGALAIGIIIVSSFTKAVTRIIQRKK